MREMICAFNGRHVAGGWEPSSGLRSGRPGSARAGRAVAWSEEPAAVAGAGSVFAAVPVAEPEVGWKGGGIGLQRVALWKNPHKSCARMETENRKRGVETGG